MGGGGGWYLLSDDWEKTTPLLRGLGVCLPQKRVQFGTLWSTFFC